MIRFKVNHTKILVFLIVFILGFTLRLVFAPDENETADPFEVLTAAKTLAETGKYLVPGIGSSDLKIHYTYAGWPVGYPLILSGIFKFFGYSEFMARLVTIFLSSLTIIFVAVIASIFFSNKVAYLSGFLMAINPLLVAFNGRIFTNNPAMLFFSASLAFLLMSVINKDKEIKFITKPSLIFKNKARLVSFLISFLLLGFLLTIRDTEAMFMPLYLYILYKAGFLNFGYNEEQFIFIIALFLLATISFIIGYLPGIYYNYQNYGAFITSTHYQWGGRLDFNYLLFGTGSVLGLPGAVVIFITALIYCFPLFLIFFVDKINRKNTFFFGAMFVFIFLPILIINGAYAVSSTGASPRYMLPLMPVVCILTAYSILNLSSKIRKIWRTGLFLIILSWHIFLTYPMPVFFKVSPKVAFAAHYSPVYQKYPYKNYPAHVNALSEWVKINTPENSVIIAPGSNPYHFYYYAKRDVITYHNVNSSALSNIIVTRPIYLVEDHEATYNPKELNKIKDIIKSSNLNFMITGEVELFSPHAGLTKMSIYYIYSQGVNG